MRLSYSVGRKRPDYIETVPKRGYRFTAPVNKLSAEALVVEKRTVTRVVTEEAVADSQGHSMIGTGEALAVAHVQPHAALRSKWPWLLSGLLAVALGIGGYNIYRSRTDPSPKPNPINRCLTV